ncbi:MAG: hypothetical protein M3Y56_06525 [Armatimonadota bacterium]|nr:hypothetical protein [Armatimonadota bacterium]
MTFACRRTCIYEQVDIERVIVDDGYRKLAEDEAMPGDVVLYFEPSGVDSIGIQRATCLAHSGIVCEVDEIGRKKVIKVLSKWGDAGEYVHTLHICPYPAATRVLIYREGYK